MIGKNVRHRLRIALAGWRLAARWDVLIEKAVTIKYGGTLQFGEHCTLQSGVYVYGSRTGKACVFEHHVVLAAGSVVLGEGGLTIGAYTHLGPRVVLTTQYGDSASPMTTPSPTVKTLPVELGRGCWIGAGSVIMPGVRLGDECVVGPGSVVYGNWPARTTLSGNPARIRKQTAFRQASATLEKTVEL